MVKYSGKVILELSHEAPEGLSSRMEEFIAKINGEVLRKGAKTDEEAAKVISYDVIGNKIVLEITAGRKIGVHIAALRAKNFLAPILGKEYRIGIRDVILTNAAIELMGRHSVKIKVPIIESIEIMDDVTRIHLRDLHEKDLQKPLLQRLIALVEEKERRKAWGGKIEHWVKIKESPRKAIIFNEDPNIILEEIGWMRNMAPGQWIYTPPLTSLLRSFEKMFIDVVLKPLGFVEAVFPKMEPLHIALKTGHLKGTPNQMIFASLPISYNIEEFEEWQDFLSIYENVDAKLLRKYTEAPTYYMCFAQCPPFYYFLSKMIFTDRNIPIKWFDKSGPSFRWEGTGGLRGIERLVEFHRIEVVWLGTQEQVISIRNQLLEKYEYFMDKVLDLEWRWAWVTPWFLVHAGETKEIEERIDINQPGTIDFEAYLPYKGDRENPKSWLEIGNISIHGAKYTKAFRIKHAAKKILWTGCSGFGVERWVLAFLAQKGFDRDSWPKMVREYTKGLPIGVEASNYPKPEFLELKRRIEKLVGAH